MITVVCIQQYRIEASNLLVALIATTIKVIARRHVFFLQLSLSPPFPILDWQIVGVEERAATTARRFTNPKAAHGEKMTWYHQRCEDVGGVWTCRGWHYSGCRYKMIKGQAQSNQCHQELLAIASFAVTAVCRSGL